MNREIPEHVLFDLDGTLLPMNQDHFVNYYFPLLSKRFEPFGVEPKVVVSSVWKGLAAMVLNDGTRTNKEVFWSVFESLTGVEQKIVEPETLAFYDGEFNEAIQATQPTPLAAELIKTLKDSGRKVYLATNPVFPRCATMNRIRWAGLQAEDFEIITTYETSHYSKPNPKYFEEVLNRCGLKADECMMVGNDAEEDLAARKIGIPTCLLTDSLENKKGLPLEAEFVGTMREFLEWVRKH